MPKRKIGKISFDGKWTPVAVNEQFILDTGASISLSELVDFEELTDYHIEEKVKKKSRKTSEVKEPKSNAKRKLDKSGKTGVKKIKTSQTVANEKPEGKEQEDFELPAAKASQKKKRTKLQVKSQEPGKCRSEPDGVPDGSSAEASTKMVPKAEQENKTVAKKDKKKKKKKGKTVSDVTEAGPEPEPTSEEVPDSPSPEEVDMSKWEQLHVDENIIKALRELKFTSPTPVQEQCLPPAIISRKDIIGAAETGSGKTLAFGIPLVQNILQDKKNEQEKGGMKKTLRGIVITPTRELAVQIRKHLQCIAKYVDVSICLIVGGMFKEKQDRLLNRRPEIIIATPGRLHDHITSGTSYLQDLSSVRYLVVDEADRMAEQGHFKELTSIMEQLNQEERAATKRQNFVFSATLCLDSPVAATRRKAKNAEMDDNKLTHLSSLVGLKSSAKLINLSKPEGIAHGLIEQRLPCTVKEKDYYFYYLLMTEATGRTLVFCNSLDCVRRLYGVFSYLLSESNRAPLILHAGMHQKQRLKNLERFHANPRGVLLASDVASRGLDIPDVQYVIHYQVPRDPDLYVHRSGRTARSFRVGNSVLLLDPSDVPAYNKILKNLNRDKDFPPVDVDLKVLRFARERVDLVRKIDSVEHGLRKGSSKDEWFLKAAEESELMLDDNDFRQLDIQAQSSRTDQSKEAKALKRQLQYMLRQPMKSNMPGFSRKYPTLNLAKKQFGIV